MADKRALVRIEEIAFRLDTPIRLVKKRLREAGIALIRPTRDVEFMTEEDYDRFLECLRDRPEMGRPRKERRSGKEAARGRPRPVPKRLSNGAGEHVLGRPGRRKVVALELERSD